VKHFVSYACEVPSLEWESTQARSKRGRTETPARETPPHLLEALVQTRQAGSSTYVNGSLQEVKK